MLKRVATLGLVLAISAGALAQAATAPKADGSPSSMDRLIAPDEMPNNVVKILRTTNKAQTNSYVPVVFTMRNNNPFNVIRMLRKPVQEEEGLLFTFVSPEGNGGKVLYCVPAYMIPSLRDLVKRVDIPGLTTSAGDKRIYRQLKHRRADSSDPDFLATALSYTTVDGTEFLTDPETNTLYWGDAPSGAANLDAVLTSDLDVPTPMVQLLVKVYELDSTNDAAIGQDYQAWKNSIGQNLFAGGAYAEGGRISRLGTTTYPPLGTGAAGLPHNSFAASGYNYAYQYEFSSAFFDFLQSKGKARVMTEAKLAALNTRPASLSAGDQVLYYAVSSTDPSGVRNSDQPFQANGGRTVVGTVNQLDSDENLVPVETGLDLTFTPTIGTQTVTLDMALSWTDYTGFADNGFPQINPRSLKSKLRMAVGDETVIGGLQRQIKTRNSSKVPFLGSLPVIGYLFGGETDLNKNTEMVVAIKPIGIMEYNLAGGSMVDSKDQNLINVATGDKNVDLPETTWGFDQYGIDTARDVPFTPEVK